MSSLEAAVARAFPHAQLVDQDEHFAYLATGERGMRRVGFQVMPGNRIRLGEAELMRPASREEERARRIADLTEKVRELALRLGTAPPGSQPPPWSDADYAPLPSTPAFLGGEAPPVCRPPTAQGVPETGAQLHMMAALGSADDFAPIATDRFSAKVIVDDHHDFMPMPASPWDRKS